MRGIPHRNRHRLCLLTRFQGEKPIVTAQCLTGLIMLGAMSGSISA